MSFHDIQDRCCRSGAEVSWEHQHHHGLYLIRSDELFIPWCRYYADVQQRSTEAEKPAKEAVIIDAEELLREAEEQAGDDGGDQVLLRHRLCSSLIPQGLREYDFQSTFSGMHGGNLRHEDVLQVLLDARGLKRLILSFERKVSSRGAC